MNDDMYRRKIMQLLISIDKNVKYIANTMKQDECIPDVMMEHEDNEDD